MEIKPCPFCGWKARIKVSKKHKKFPFIVQCTNPSCACRTDRWNVLEGAVRAWNRKPY